MKTLFVLLNRQQSAMARATNSGPLSKRALAGAPRWAVRWSRPAATWSALMERIGQIAATLMPAPARRFLWRRCGTRSPSACHRRRMRLLLTFQPARRYETPNRARSSIVAAAR